MVENMGKSNSGKRKDDYIILRAEPAHREQIIQLLERFVTTQRSAQRYDWIYQRNPQGEAATWLACEPAHGQIVGFTSIFARDFKVADEMVSAGIGFDAFVRPDHRRRGIAVHLHKASMEAMARGEVPFKFMCGPPVRANLDALLKAGTKIVGGLRYLGLPLNHRGLMTMLHVRNHQYNFGVTSAMSDYVLKGLRRLFNRNCKEINVRVVDHINYKFDRLWEKLSRHFDVIGRRDGAYLNWRYLQNPVCWQQLVALEKGGELLGWAALEFAPQGCLLVDYLLPLEKGLGDQALAALVHYVAEQRACRLTLRFNLHGHYTNLFLRHGFLPGWSVEQLQTLCPHKELLPTLLEISNWHFSNGDLNPESSPWSVNFAPQAEWASASFDIRKWSEQRVELPERMLELQPRVGNNEV